MLPNSDLFSYDWFKDQGGTISGVLALIAGFIAYLAGVRQAKAATDGAKDQVATMRQQMSQAKRMAEEHDKRSRENLLHALGMEASRLKMEAEQQLQRLAVLNTQPDTYIDAKFMNIYGHEISLKVRESHNVGALLPRETARAVSALVASVDQVNTILKVRSASYDLPVGVLVKAIQNVAAKADELNGAIAELEDKRPSSHVPLPG